MLSTTSAIHADINVTPLVDVCLVLLIIFMVMTPLMVTGLPVELPQVGTAEALAKQPMQITLKEDGTVYVGGNVVREDEVAGALATEREKSDRPLVVRADKSVPYGQVAKLLSACREAGFMNVGLAAEAVGTQ